MTNSKLDQDIAFLMKHNEGSARFSTFPKVSTWEDSHDLSAFKERIDNAIESNESFDLYVHIPYCENVCTFCGCNIKVTKSHSEENDYLEILNNEFTTYFPKKPLIKKLYLGGGTPNFLSLDHLTTFIQSILDQSQQDQDFEIIMEADPRFINENYLMTLKNLGLTRIHFGIQDLDTNILNNVNRITKIEDVFNALEITQKLDIKIGIDLIYGLPLQSVWNIENNFDKLLKYKIEHFSFYPLAEVPWMKKIQKAYGNFETPSIERKFELFLTGYDLLTKNNYFHLGLGHFILKESFLYEGFKKGTLSRNQMSLFNNASKNYIGLGVSAISKVQFLYKQNEKIIDKYFYSTMKKSFFMSKSHKQSLEDQIKEKVFNNLYTNEKSSLDINHQDFVQIEHLDREDELFLMNEKARLITKYIFKE